jgi:cytoplasmic iron level regulating protein YaaA (DUF328/UPF0246 family)
MRSASAKAKSEKPRDLKTQIAPLLFWPQLLGTQTAHNRAMLFLLSPSKRLDYATPLPPGLPHTLPQLAGPAAELAGALRGQTPAQLARLLQLDDRLAALNVARYAAWQRQATADNARQALFAFAGDVYGALDARTLTHAELDWAQERLVILSGLYGALRPLDWMQPYRLEMGAKLPTAHGADLYQFWGARIAGALNARLAGEAAPTVVNLASREYFKAVAREALKARVIECVFEDYRGGRYRVIGLLAKRARGLMARYAVQHKLVSPDRLKDFDLEGYAFAMAASEPERLVFRRKR